jgi:hypothetical protein
MNNAAMFGKLAALGLVMGGIAGVTATTAQAARNVVTYSPYDPATAYTGDLAFAPRAQAVEPGGNHALSNGPRLRAPANAGPSQPYLGRPYGDPDSW